LFEYSPEALSRGIELSPRHLKLRAAAYGDFPDYQSRLPGLVADALPDGWGLLLMDRFFSKHFRRQPHQVSPLDRLAFLGERAMGALAFEPATDTILETPDLELLALAREVQAVVADRDTAALKQLLVLGGSPQGARPKALVQYDAAAGSVSTRNDAPGTPWLVKFPGRHEHREVCAIESCYARLARECGLDMPRARYFDLGPRHAAFGIERFDRGEGMRVPMHTLAGALHADFRLPGVSYQTLLRATRLFTHSEREVEKAFERCVFNVVFHNRDDHAKNFSFRMDRAWRWKLAPCYDLSYLSYCEGPGGEHQMDVEGEGREPGRPHLMRLAASNSLDVAWAATAIDRVAAAAGAFSALCKDYPIRAATRQRMARAVEANRRRVA
jgi:serine/threonine-protein kinase HipA